MGGDSVRLHPDQPDHSRCHFGRTDLVGAAVLTLRVIFRANTDRLAVLAASCAVGALAGLALVYLTLALTDDHCDI